ncbi:MAG: shikimate kinase [Alphaproteobacteria bacterium]|jgi:shikimate kinase|nr:shikimate kinase [Alphaproteobacteria bacterium]MBT4016499.1 shikimate kinase [Alphaproteobacteria bacterium]MBT5160082.1 shikimate kinase [Alphaproteobacteria bacterium]MBT5918711.1 shikimate kinase [Alphaproteobacteria bacterium]MBT6387415.1 shikimate kinase [Alphaproteobacteria bacterium]
MTEDTSSDDDRITDSVPVLDRSLVLVGLMGAGKSTIGRRLAARLDLPFVDADNEIEAAADCSIQEIFDEHGEDYFRDGERRVIERLLNGPVCVLATGGGAFMNQTTRELIKQKGRSLWLRADIEILVQRTSRRSHRPLLNKGNPREILQDLMDQRYPVYQTADYSVETDDSPHSVVVERALSALTEQRPLDENGTLA